MTASRGSPSQLPLQRRQVLLALWIALATTSCQSKRGVEVHGEVVKAGCAMCMFKMPGVKRCMWAVEIGNQVYLAEGNLPKHHDAHGEGGMCTMYRKAIVDGTLLNGKFVATRFDLMPPAATQGGAKAPHPHQH